MSLDVYDYRVQAVLLDDGWHEVDPKVHVFELDAYEITWGPKSGMSDQPGESTGFIFGTGDGNVIVGPFSSIRGLRLPVDYRDGDYDYEAFKNEVGIAD